jgi:hypothetical protein
MKNTKNQKPINETRMAATAAKNLCEKYLMADTTEKQTKALLQIRWENEADIERAAGKLEKDIEDGVTRLQETLIYLRTNQADHINSCGILQGLACEIEHGVGALQAGLKMRLAINKITE